MENIEINEDIIFNWEIDNMQFVSNLKSQLVDKEVDENKIILCLVQKFFIDKKIKIEQESDNFKFVLEYFKKNIGECLEDEDLKMLRNLNQKSNKIKKLLNKEVPTLDQMRPAECMKCEVFKNVCQKCTYYINNKCEGR